MAIGIDDALTAATAGISLASTCVDTVQKFRREGRDVDIKLLIEQVRITAMERIDAADIALVQLERLLMEKGINLEQSLLSAISETPWWRPFEAHLLKRIHRSFNDLADATYGASDDVASLVRCRDRTAEMGPIVAESARRKRAFQQELMAAESIGIKIRILRHELDRQKAILA